MGMLQEFKEFAMRGNVVDMAVGVVIGGAFGKIVASFALTLKQPVEGAAAVAINYGKFINVVIDFAIVAFAIFLLVKAMNTLIKKAPPPPAAPSREEVLLTEIRDALRR